MKNITFSNISQALVIATSVVYIVGFVCVNSFLFSLNFTSIEIISTSYITAGIYTIVSVAVALLIASQYSNVYKTFKPKDGTPIWEELSMRTLFMLIAVSTFSYIFGTLLGFSADSFQNYDLSFKKRDILARVINLVFSKSDELTKLSIWYSFWPILAVGILVGVIYGILLLDKRLSSKPTNEKTSNKLSVSKTNKEDLWVRIAKIIIDVVAVPYALFKIVESLLLVSRYNVTLNNLGSLSLSSKEYFVWLYLSTIFFSFGLWMLDLEKIKSAGKSIFRAFVDDPYQKIFPLSLSMLISVSFFGKVIYSRISPSMGGGNARKVGIISSKYPELSTSRYKQFYLLTSTNESYLLIGEDSVGNKSAFEIRKDLIDILWSGDPKIFF